jgi:hypothetical protein
MRSDFPEAAMRKLHAFTDPRPRIPSKPFTLGWTEFAILALLVALMVLLGGFAVWHP